MTQEEMRIESALLWQMSWPRERHEHTRKTQQLFFCKSPKADVKEMSLAHQKSRVELYDFSKNETNLRNSTRSGKQSSDDETNCEANLSGYDLSISTSPVLFSQSASRMDEESYSKTQEPFDDASTSCWTHDLFPSLRIPSDYTRSFSGQKMNSAPLFSFSENSSLSDSFRALVASPPVISVTIADPLLIKKNTFQFQNQFHSTPKKLNKIIIVIKSTPSLISFTTCLKFRAELKDSPITAAKATTCIQEEQ